MSSAKARPTLGRWLRGGDQSDLAGDASSAQPAVAARGLVEVLLMVLLSVVEGTSHGDLAGDLAPSDLRKRLLVVAAGLLGFGQLRLGKAEDAGPVLSSDVGTLAHCLGGVVGLPEDPQQLRVGDLLRVVDHQHGLSIAGAAAADLLVARVGTDPAAVTDRGGVNPRQLPKVPLGTPETAHREDGPLGAL